MKTLIKSLLVVWMLLISLTQLVIIDTQIYDNLTMRGIVLDLSNLQQKVFVK